MFKKTLTICYPSQVALVVKNMPAKAGDMRDLNLIPGLRRSSREGHGNPFQCSCLENEKRNRLPSMGSQRVRHDWSNLAYTSTSCVMCAHSTLCTDCSPPGSSVHGIIPARMLEWVAISSSYGSWLCRWILYPLSHQGSPICYLT